MDREGNVDKRATGPERDDGGEEKEGSPCLFY